VSLFLSILLATGGAMFLSACEDQDGPAEEIGEAVDDAADETGDSLEDAADKVEDAVDGH
jgi:hypothetical protein